MIHLLTLKLSWLGRASVAHHDAHHLRSGHGGRAKNFGENFWIWDALFGTLSTFQPDRPAAKREAYPVAG